MPHTGQPPPLKQKREADLFWNESENKQDISHAPYADCICIFTSLRALLSQSSIFSNRVHFEGAVVRRNSGEAKRMVKSPYFSLIYLRTCTLYLHFNEYTRSLYEKGSASENEKLELVCLPITVHESMRMLWCTQRLVVKILPSYLPEVEEEKGDYSRWKISHDNVWQGVREGRNDEFSTASSSPLPFWWVHLIRDDVPSFACKQVWRVVFFSGISSTEDKKSDDEVFYFFFSPSLLSLIKLQRT